MQVRSNTRAHTDTRHTERRINFSHIYMRVLKRTNLYVCTCIQIYVCSSTQEERINGVVSGNAGVTGAKDAGEHSAINIYIHK